MLAPGRSSQVTAGFDYCRNLYTTLRVLFFVRSCTYRTQDDRYLHLAVLVCTKSLRCPTGPLPSFAHGARTPRTQVQAKIRVRQLPKVRRARQDSGSTSRTYY